MFNILLPFILELFELLETILKESNTPKLRKKPTRNKNITIDFGI